MEWAELYPITKKPEWDEISDYVSSSLWEELYGFIEETYRILPCVEYSKCQWAPGWNVKYKKGGRSLCTLYPNKGYFTCLITIGRKEADEAERMIYCFSDYLQELYQNAGDLNGSKWLMIDITTSRILEEAMELICVRIPPRGLKRRENR